MGWMGDINIFFSPPWWISPPRRIQKALPIFLGESLGQPISTKPASKPDPAPRETSN